MRRSVLLSLAGAVVAFSAAAQPPAPAKPADSCFRTRDLRSHTVGGPHTLYFNVAGTDVYRVETSNSCLASVISADPFVLRDTGLGRICNKLDLIVSIRGNRCIIDSITRMSPAEVAALPKRMLP